MTIRPGTIDEVEVLAQLGLHFCRSGIYPLVADATEASLIAILLAVLDLGERGCLFVAEDRTGQIVGGIAAVEAPEPITHTLYADELCWWMEPAHRGGPAAIRLKRAFEDWADARGLGAKMFAPAGSDIGILYERTGYAPIETVYYRAAPGRRPR